MTQQVSQRGARNRLSRPGCTFFFKVKLDGRTRGVLHVSIMLKSCEHESSCSNITVVRQ